MILILQLKQHLKLPTIHSWFIYIPRCLRHLNGVEWHYYMKDCLYRGSRQRGWPDEISSIAFVLYLIGIFYIKILWSTLGFSPVRGCALSIAFKLVSFCYLFITFLCHLSPLQGDSPAKSMQEEYHIISIIISFVNC